MPTKSKSWALQASLGDEWSYPFWSHLSRSTLSKSTLTRSILPRFFEINSCIPYGIVTNCHQSYTLTPHGSTGSSSVTYFNFEGPCTNNHVEGWHSRLKKVAGKLHHNIYEIIDVFKRGTSTKIKMQMLEAGAQQAPGRRWMKQRRDESRTCLLNSIPEQSL